jgi:DNA-binding NarL/FixJ family response regulator
VSRARLLLADDHEEFLAIEVQLLEPEFEVVTTARDGRTAIQEASRLSPDLLIIDIDMCGFDGIVTAKLLRAAGSRAKIVFLTTHGDPDYVRAGLAAGADGYVVKSRLASDLVLALREVLAGRSFVSPSIRLS